VIAQERARVGREAETRSGELIYFYTLVSEITRI
jgi:hypothetical protein